MAEHEQSYSTISSSDIGSNRNKVITRKTTTVTPYDINSGAIPPPGTQEEWTTTKRRINHKTKQVETRVQRQIIMEDGKVIADSGPQVTTKTTEDQKSDETEDTKHRLLGDSDVPEKYRKDIGNQVVAEKTVTHNVTKEAKEENYQYHDESLRELDGPEIHRKAVEEPHKLISIENEIPAIPRGKLVHFSAKGRKTNDRDEILEISRLDKDGMLNTETTQTQYHEEYEDDEVPEDDAGRMLEGSSSGQRQLEYSGDHRIPSRTNSSLSMSRGQDNKIVHKSSRKNKENQGRYDVDPGDDDIIETSEVYRLSDKMKSLKTSSNKNHRHHSSTKGKLVRKDDASTQASMSDCSDDEHSHGHSRMMHSKHKQFLQQSSSTHNNQEIHERPFGSRRSSFRTHDDECCDLTSGHHKPLTSKKQPEYYYGTDMDTGTLNGDEKGFIQATVKTSKFAMENDRVIEDKTFEEDFERSFKGKNEKYDVKRDYDRFREKTLEHTKGISPMMLPPTAPATSEYIHRPLLVDHHSSSSSFNDKPTRSRSFYNHQIEEYENSGKYKTSGNDSQSQSHFGSGYSSLPKDPFGSSGSTTGAWNRVISPIGGSGTWTKHQSTTNRDHISHRYDSHRSSGSSGPGYQPASVRSYSTPRTGSGGIGSRTDFPDFQPLSSPYEIKSLTENALKTRHITTYN